MSLTDISRNDSNLQNPNQLGGFFRARVEDNKDPKHIGRVRVRVPMLHGMKVGGVATKYLPWATMIAIGAGYQFGSFIVPEVGEYVLVGFEDNDQSKPFYIGSIYGTGAKSKKGKEYGTGKGDDEQWYSKRGEVETDEDAQREVPTKKLLYKSPKFSQIYMDEQTGNEEIVIQDPLEQDLTFNAHLTSKKNKGPDAKKTKNFKTSEIKLTDAAKQTVTMHDDKKGSVIEAYTEIKSGPYSVKVGPCMSDWQMVGQANPRRHDNANEVVIEAKTDRASVTIDNSGNITINTNGAITMNSANSITVNTSASLSVSGAGSGSIITHPLVLGQPAILLE